MKIDTATFRGEIPRASPDKLPEGAAQEALNARLHSGSLEPWMGQANAAYFPNGDAFPTPSVRTLFLMDPDGTRGGPFPLYWPGDVSVARAPIAGDEDERTIFCGDGPPKMTTLPLATDEPPPSGRVVGQYPYRWSALGVPAPTAAPTLDVQTDELSEGEIALTNAGAESDITGWTVTGGVLVTRASGDVAGVNAYAGTRYFSAGAAASTDAYQSRTMSADGVVPGVTLRLAWRQIDLASSDDIAGMGLQFFDASSNNIGELFATLNAGGKGAWQERSVSLAVPNAAVTYRVVQRYRNTGGDPANPGNTWVGIDAIKLTISSSAVTFDGSTLAGWLTTSTDSAATITVDASNGWPAPSFRFWGHDGSVACLYRDMQVADAPVYQVDFECMADNTSGGYLRQAVVLNADAGGSGAQIHFGESGIYAQNTASWSSVMSGETLLAPGNHQAVRFRATVRVESGGGLRTVYVTTKRSDNGQVIASAQTTIGSNGGFVGFKGWVQSGEDKAGWLDNIRFNITPAIPNPAGDLIYTQYVFTWVNALANESAPSPVSRTVQIGDRVSVLITTPTATPSGYDIPTKRLYRAVTLEDGTAAFRLVAEVDAGEAEYLDTKPDSQLEVDVLTTDGWDAPPADATLFVAMANGVCVYAAGNQVFPTPAGYPHAAPALWAKPCDYDVVALATVDTDCYVLTQAGGYILAGADPSAMDMQKLDKPIGCVSTRSVVVMSGYGVVYASADGLTYANRGGMGLLTQAWLTEREWRALKPSSILGVVYDGLYFGFYNNGTPGGFVFDPSPGGFGFVHLSTVATAAVANPVDDTLVMAVSGKLRLFNRGTTPQAYRWRSREYQLPYAACFSMARVVSDGGALTLKVYYDGVLVATRTVSDSRPFMLAPVRAKEHVAVQLEGTARVKRVLLGESVEDLR